MIARIVVNRGRKRTALDLPTRKAERIGLGNKLKGHLFPGGSFLPAKRRGAAAIAAALA